MVQGQRGNGSKTEREWFMDREGMVQGQRGNGSRTEREWFKDREGMVQVPLSHVYLKHDC